MEFLEGNQWLMESKAASTLIRRFFIPRVDIEYNKKPALRMDPVRERRERDRCRANFDGKIAARTRLSALVRWFCAKGSSVDVYNHGLNWIERPDNTRR